MTEAIIAAQMAWKTFILEAGQRYRDKLDYRRFAMERLDTLYAFDTHAVIFKPTLAKDPSFRNDKISAMHYFIGDAAMEEAVSQAFALQPWTDIRFDNQCIAHYDGILLVAGQYHFSQLQKAPVCADYTFGYVASGMSLKIVLQHSSLIV